MEADKFNRNHYADEHGNFPTAATPGFYTAMDVNDNFGGWSIQLVSRQLKIAHESIAGRDLRFVRVIDGSGVTVPVPVRKFYVGDAAGHAFNHTRFESHADAVAEFMRIIHRMYPPRDHAAGGCGIYQETYEMALYRENQR